MSADRLREAARVLREMATAATKGQWCVADTTDERSEWHDDYEDPMVVTGDSWPGVRCEIAVCSQDGEREGAPDARYIATMHPGVGLALADWLDAHAATGDPEAVRLADLILGGAA